MAESTLGKVRKTQMGATDPVWAPITSEEGNALPKYGTVMDFSEFEKVTEALTQAEARYYSNDAMSESTAEFSYCTLTYSHKGMTDELNSAIYGADYTDGEVTYGGDDNPPLGGFGFHRTIMDKGVKYYEGVFYPRVKASLTGGEYATKGENVTFVGETTTLIAYECKDAKRTWKKTQLFATAEEAKAWVRTKFTEAV